jgi:uncharacterized SAM-binding protein YcdF (DUF218 family)
MSFSGTAFSTLRSFLAPPACLFLLYFFGLLLSRKWPRPGRALSLAAISILLIFSTNIGAYLLCQPLEALEQPLRSPLTSGAQAIVVLTAGRISDAPEYGGKDIPDYVALARAGYAAKLYRETGLPLLVTGGIGPEDGYNESLAAGLARALQQQFGVPVRWTEERSKNTAENASYSALLLKQAGVQRILLVTDAMHMRRARLAFEKQGFSVVAAPTMFFSENKMRLQGLIPGAENLRRSCYAVYEWMGLLWYESVHI